MAVRIVKRAGGPALILALAMVAWALLAVSSVSGSTLSVNYYYPALSYECVFTDTWMHVTQSMDLFVFEGFVDVFRIYLPWGEGEIRDLQGIEAATGERNLSFAITQTDTQTIIEAAPPARIYGGDSIPVALSYTIHDVPGDDGVCRESGEDCLEVFSPLLETQVGELTVAM